MDGESEHLASVSELEASNEKVKVKSKYAFSGTAEDEAS